MSYRWRGAPAVILMAGFASVALFLWTERQLDGPVAFRWVTYANTALAGSTVMYAVYLWIRADPIGRAATVLAAGGAAGVLGALLTGLLFADNRGLGLYEGTALVSAIAVAAYLAMERAYRSRSAGIVVMPAVMAAVFCEMWLIGHGFASTGRLGNGLNLYWEAGHRFAVCLGYVPLVAAAILSVGRGAPRRARTLNAAVLGALSVGAPLLLLGAGMGAVWWITEASSARSVIVHVLVLVLVTTLVLVTWLRVRGPEDPRLSRHAIATFLVSTTGLLVAGPLAAALR